MLKPTVMLAILLSCLLTLGVAELHTAKAQEFSIDMEFVSSPPGYVDQPFEVAVIVSGGTPPYSYQWYTKWFPPWEAGMNPEQYRASGGDEIAVLGATSSTFTFTPTVEGIYWISVGISDSAGNLVEHFPSIQPFQVIVGKNTAPQISPSPPSTLPPQTPTIPEIPNHTALIILVAVLLAIMAHKRKN
jgi:hypothetical protein